MKRSDDVDSPKESQLLGFFEPSQPQRIILGLTSKERLAVGQSVLTVELSYCRKQVFLMSDVTSPCVCREFCLELEMNRT